MLVVGASVAILWLFPQPRTTEAAAVLRSGEELIGPDLLQIEVASVVLRAVRRGDLPADVARQGVFEALPATVRTAEVPGLARSAYILAASPGGSFYDAVYVALARSGARPRARDRRCPDALARLQGALQGPAAWG